MSTQSEGQARVCGHKHRCACGSNLSPLTHSDPEAYRRFGGCDRPCARCDSLDAQEAERGY